MCGTGDVSADAFQPGLVQQIDARPGPPGPRASGNEARRRRTVTRPGVPAWWLPGVLNFLCLEPVTHRFLLNQAPEERGHHCGAGSRPDAGWRCAHRWGGRLASSLWGVQEAGGGTRAGPRLPLALDCSYRLQLALLPVVRWLGATNPREGLPPQPQRMPGPPTRSSEGTAFFFVRLYLFLAGSSLLPQSFCACRSPGYPSLCCTGS